MGKKATATRARRVAPKKQEKPEIADPREDDEEVEEQVDSEEVEETEEEGEETEESEESEDTEDDEDTNALKEEEEELEGRDRFVRDVIGGEDNIFAENEKEDGTIGFVTVDGRKYFFDPEEEE